MVLVASKVTGSRCTHNKNMINIYNNCIIKFYFIFNIYISTTITNIVVNMNWSVYHLYEMILII